jgi:hypothetical protein
MAKVTNQQVIDALERSAGILSAAAELLPVSRQAIQDRINRYPSLAVAQMEIKEKNIDFAESKLMQGIKSGNMTAIIFYLKTMGKDRGYMERQQVEDVTKYYDFSGCSDKQLASINKELKQMVEAN